MIVERHGSERNHGPSRTNLVFETPTVLPGHMLIESKNVSDFSTPATHDWTLFIRFDELRTILDAIAQSIEDNKSADVAAALSPCLTAILKIATACSAQPIAGPDPPQSETA